MTHLMLGNTCILICKEALVFTCMQYNCFENTEGKGEIAGNEPFNGYDQIERILQMTETIFPQCSRPFWRTLSHFHPNKKLLSTNS